MSWLKSLALVTLLLFSFALADNNGNGNGHGNDHDDDDDDNEHNASVIGGVRYTRCRMSPPRHPSTRVFEYCPNAVVNGVSVGCREYWMRKAMEVQFNGSVGTANHLCPTSFFGTVVVNHTDGSPSNPHVNGQNCGAFVARSSGRRGSLDDPSNHAEVNATKVIADTFRGNGRNRAFWGQLTQYTTGESCSMCTGHQVFAGYKEVVYSVRIGDFINMGDGQTRISSVELANKQIGFVPANPMVYIGQVLADEIRPYFAWRLDANAPCPTGCSAFNDGGNRCRMF